MQINSIAYAFLASLSNKFVNSFLLPNLCTKFGGGFASSVVAVVFSVPGSFARQFEVVDSLS